jgi:hypothetical protein
MYSHLVNPYRDTLSTVGRGKKRISFGWYKEKERRQQEFQFFRNNKSHEIQSKEGPRHGRNAAFSLPFPKHLSPIYIIAI